jgi:hypothetical protein
MYVTFAINVAQCNCQQGQAEEKPPGPAKRQHCIGPFFTALVSWQVTPYEVRSEPFIGFNFGKYLNRIDRQLGTPKTA